MASVQQNLGYGAGTSLCGQRCPALRVLHIKEISAHPRKFEDISQKAFSQNFFLIVFLKVSTDHLHSSFGAWQCFFFLYQGIMKIIPSKMEVSTAMMSYDFKMSSDYNHDVLKL